jgi:hypothetical protein
MVADMSENESTEYKKTLGQWHWKILQDHQATI